MVWFSSHIIFFISSSYSQESVGWLLSLHTSADWFQWWQWSGWLTLLHLLISSSRDWSGKLLALTGRWLSTPRMSWFSLRSAGLVSSPSVMGLCTQSWYQGVMVKSLPSWSGILVPPCRSIFVPWMRHNTVPLQSLAAIATFIADIWTLR